MLCCCLLALCSFIHSLIHSFIHFSTCLVFQVRAPLPRSFALSLVHSSIHSFIHLFIHSFIHSFLYLPCVPDACASPPFICSFALTCSFVHSPMHSFVRSFVHSFLSLHCVPGACASPLGLGWDYTLPDSAFSASSELTPGECTRIATQPTTRGLYLLLQCPICVTMSFFIRFLPYIFTYNNPDVNLISLHNPWFHQDGIL